jgi:hypothetical protein
MKSMPPVDIGPFTQIPNRLFASGTAAKIGPSATTFYAALCERANRKGSNTFSASDRSFESDTGLSPRTLRDLRPILSQYCLITLERKNGRSYTYTILRPPAMEYIGIGDRLREKRRPRAYSVRASTFPEKNHPKNVLTEESLYRNNPYGSANFAGESSKSCRSAPANSAEVGSSDSASEEPVPLTWEDVMRGRHPDLSHGVRK